MTLFNKGIPTEIDVARLLEHFGQPAVGQILSYADVAGVIGTAIGSNRFKTVTTRWRKRLEDQSRIYTKAEDHHFQVLTEAERVGKGRGHNRRAIRQASKAHKVCADFTPDELAVLTPVQRAEREHEFQKSAKIISLHVVTRLRPTYAPPPALTAKGKA